MGLYKDFSLSTVGYNLDRNECAKVVVDNCRIR